MTKDEKIIIRDFLRVAQLNVEQFDSYQLGAYNKVRELIGSSSLTNKHHKE